MKRQVFSIILALSLLASLCLTFGVAPISAENTIPVKPADNPELATVPKGTDGGGYFATWENPIRMESGAAATDYVYFDGFTGLASGDSYVLKATMKVTAQSNGVWSGPEILFRTGSDDTAYKVVFQGNCSYLFKGSVNCCATIDHIYAKDTAFAVAIVVSPAGADVYMDGTKILGYDATQDASFTAGTPEFRIYAGGAKVLISDYSAYDATDKSVPPMPEGSTNLATTPKGTDGGGYFATWENPIRMESGAAATDYVYFDGFTEVASGDSYVLKATMKVTAQSNGVWSGPEIMFRDAAGTAYKAIFQANSTYLFKGTENLASTTTAGQYYTLNEEFTIALVVKPTGVDLCMNGASILGYDATEDAHFATALPRFYIYGGNARVLVSNCVAYVTERTHTHTPGNWEIVRPATDTAAGEKVKKCTECHDVLETEIIPQLAPSGDPDALPQMPIGSKNAINLEAITGDTSSFTYTTDLLQYAGGQDGKSAVFTVDPSLGSIDDYVISFWVKIPKDAEDWTGFDVITNRDTDQHTESIAFMPNVVYVKKDGDTLAQCTNIKLPRGKYARVDIRFENTDEALIRRIYIDGTALKNDWSGNEKMGLSRMAPAFEIRTNKVGFSLSSIRGYAADKDATAFEPATTPIEPSEKPDPDQDQPTYSGAPRMPKGAKNLSLVNKAIGDTSAYVIKGSSIKMEKPSSAAKTVTIPLDTEVTGQKPYVVSFKVKFPADCADWTGFEITTACSGNNTQTVNFAPNAIYIMQNGNALAECTNVKLPRGKEAKVDILFTPTAGRMTYNVYVDGTALKNNWSNGTDIPMDAMTPALSVTSNKSAFALTNIRTYFVDYTATEFEDDDTLSSDNIEQIPDTGDTSPLLVIVLCILSGLSLLITHKTRVHA